jgi:hypothetical protein
VPVDSIEGEVRLFATGPESDAFLALVAQSYGTSDRPTSMAPQTRFNCLSLGGDPRKLDRRPVHMKLIYGAGDKRDYAELLLDVDVPNRRVVLREKDEAYREAVVRALTRRDVR